MPLSRPLDGDVSYSRLSFPNRQDKIQSMQRWPSICEYRGLPQTIHPLSIGMEKVSQDIQTPPEQRYLALIQHPPLLILSGRIKQAP
ncbi:hypothetical protein BASA83_007017 [Batrachochytrium salamandrivorans]|nr:hypothetical protein BASA83_007017 [Batrachochytrium salamandrivorans]